MFLLKPILTNKISNLFGERRVDITFKLLPGNDIFRAGKKLKNEPEDSRNISFYFFKYYMKLLTCSFKILCNGLYNLP